MKTKYLLSIIYLIPISSFAQQSWNLKACIEYGLKNNRNGAVYENEKKAADAKAKEALADYLPKIGLTGTFDDNLKVQESIIPAGVFGPAPLKIAFTQKYNTNAVAQLDQTIYDQALLTGLKANNFNRQQADLNIRQNDETTIYNIGNSYYQINVYREQLHLLEEDLETYRREQEVYQLQVKKGVALQKDLDKVTVNYNNVLSQIRVAQSNLSLSENQLKYNMGYPIKGVLLIDSLSRNEISLPTGMDTGIFNFSPSNRADYQLSEVNIKLLDVDQKRVKASAIPKLTGYARYGAVGFGSTLGPAFTDLNSFSAVGLKLTIPILDFFKRNAQYTQAKIKSINAAENLKLDEGKYQLEYENAKAKLIKAQSNMESDKRNIDLAQSVFRATDLQLKKGVTDLTDWLNAQYSIRDAQNNYLNSLYTYYQAKLDLEKAGGTLKTFYTSL